MSISREVIEEFLDEANGFYKGRFQIAYHYSAVVLEDGSLYKGDENKHVFNVTPCFAWIRNIPYEIQIKYILFYQQNHEYYSKEVEYQYFNYIMNESVFKEAFACTLDEVLETRVVVVRADVPNHIAYGALISMRMAYEYNRTGFINIWYGLVKEGVNKDLANMVAYHSYKEGDLITWDNNISDGHTVLESNLMGETECKNFLNHKPNYLKNSLDRNRRVMGLNSIWGGGKNGSFIKHLLLTEYVPSNHSDQNKNIFKKKNNFETFDDGIKNMSKFCQNVIMKRLKC